jgi:hypothetical protein
MQKGIDIYPFLHVIGFVGTSRAQTERIRHTLEPNPHSYRFFVDDYFTVVQGEAIVGQLLAMPLRSFRSRAGEFEPEQPDRGQPDKGHLFHTRSRKYLKRWISRSTGVGISGHTLKHVAAAVI